jgi:hypothetical protein
MATPAITTPLPQDVEKYIGEVDKGRGAKVKVRLNTFKGKDYIDLRIFLGDKIPTTKGVSLPIDKLSALISLLEKAEEEVSKRA